MSTQVTTARRSPLTTTLPIAVAALCSVAFGCAHGGVGSVEGWSAVRSRHFTIYTDRPRDVELVVRDLELAHSAIGGAFFKTVDLPNVEVLVLAPEAFGELLGFRRNSVTLPRAPGASGLGQSGLLVMENDEGGVSASEALGHLFIAKSFPTAPLWFHEGFASYMSTVIYREGDKGHVACFGLLPDERETLLPVEKLLSIDWHQYDGDQARSWYRYSARVLIDYILHGGDGKNAARMRPLIEALAAGKSGRDSFDAAFPSVSLPFLDRKLAEHAADLSSAGVANKRGLCPLPAKLPAEHHLDNSTPREAAAPTDKLRQLLDALLKLPRRDGYPRWYPAEVLAAIP